MQWTLPDPAVPPPPPTDDPFDMVLSLMMDRLFESLAPGVEGCVSTRYGYFEVVGVRSTVPRVPGAVGRWLDALPADEVVVVPFVVSDRLAGMLERRGFTGPDAAGTYRRAPR